jgi:SSS family solute:Na+ symporter
MSTLAIATIAGLVLYGVILAIISRKSTVKASTSGNSSKSEFFVAGRSVGPLILLATMCLSLWSAATFYGWPSAGYRIGWGYYAGVTGMFFTGVTVPCIFYPYWLLGGKYGYVSPVSIITHRYGSRFLTLLCSAVFLICSVPYIATQVIAVGNGISIATDGQIAFGVVAAIMIIYTFAHVVGGGNSSVVNSDAFAGLVGVSIIFIFTIICASKILPDVGGLVGATKYIQETNPELLIHSGTQASGLQNIGISLSTSISCIVWPHILVRAFMGKDTRVFKLQATAIPLIIMVMFSFILFQGVYLGRIAFPGLDAAAAENVLPLLAMNYAPIIVTVVVLLGILAFGLSTADSICVAGLSMLQVDILKKEDEDTPKKTLYLCLTGFALAVSLCVIFRPAALLTYCYSFASPGWAQMIPAIVGGMFWKRGTKEGAITSVIGGMIGVCYGLFGNHGTDINPVLWGLALSVPLYILVSLAFAPDKQRAGEVCGFLHDELHERNAKPAFKILVLLSIALYFYDMCLVNHIGDANTVILGWVPIQLAGHWVTGISMAIIGYFLCKNRFGSMQVKVAEPRKQG